MDLSGLLEVLRGTWAYAELMGALKRGCRPTGLNLLRSARPYVVATIASEWGGPVLIVAAMVERAQHLAEQIPLWVPGKPVLRFAEPSPIFYDRIPWGSSAIRARIRALAALASPPGVYRSGGPHPILIASARTLMLRTLPPREFRAGSRILRVGMEVHLGRLLGAWMEVGYEPVSLVTEPGTFSHRGGIIDVYPPAEEFPVRVELFGDHIESIRSFDPGTQRSVGQVERVVITPAREALPKYGPIAAERLNAWVDSLPDDIAGIWREDLKKLTAGEPFQDLEFYLPYLYTSPAGLLDYLPDEALVVVDDWESLRQTIGVLEEQAVRMRRERVSKGQLPADMPLPYITWDEIREALEERRPLHLAGYEPERDDEILAAMFSPGPRYGGRVEPLLQDIHRWSAGGERIVIVTRQAQRLADLWAQSGGETGSVRDALAEPPPSGVPMFMPGALLEGWTFRPPGGPILRLLTDAELFGWRKPEPSRRRARRPIAPEAYFADLSPGDYVVHEEYGIGRFVGLVRMSLEGREVEYLAVSFAGGDMLYVPIHHADRLTRYIGADDRPPQLSRLGTRQWQFVRESARRAVEDVARELLELYAAREVAKGYAFSPDTPWQHELEASFPYEETEDQIRALAEVKADMESPRPMDRLICGDVGYGKTEVALRAAFKAVMDGKQVAMLVPTTVLAQQHWETFKRRLINFPIRVEMLSRFRTPEEQVEILRGLRDGTVDIVIGTHRLLQDDVQFKDLGLVIIDEEQRFGVTHKERFKKMRTEVDVLTMTATPIPRTLYLSLSGVRDISTIQTAPEDRLPVKTHVGPYDEELVRRAVLYEIGRGGQVYYVHNRVQTIETVARRLRELVPEATIEVAHGQMEERRLEDVMGRFADGEFDVLVATTIIESGLDIPNANTLIVDRAENFGMAQLYQLRGRVGRGASQAYAYFFYSPRGVVSPEARARLETIAEQGELGAGFSVAMRDLEMRGAGDILGTRQSGHITAVGFHLYTRMLAEAVEQLKAEAEGRPPPPPPPEAVVIDIPLPAYIPSDYISDTSLRLRLYRRLAGLRTLSGLEDIEAEMADRFGPLPPEVKNLLYQLKVKLLAIEAGAKAVVGGGGSQVGIKLPYLPHVDRAVLQRMLGEPVRVSRKGVWIPRDIGRTRWMHMLVEVLEKLAQFRRGIKASIEIEGREAE